MTLSAPRITLGIGGLLGHDANAALLVDGELIGAAQEERFTRIKHDGSFPRLAINDCLSMAGLKAEDVQQVVFAEKGVQTQFFQHSQRSGTKLTRWLGRMLPEGVGCLYHQEARALIPHAKFHHAWHHLSHVVGAFHSSPFEKAAFLCVDGKGEDYSASAGIIDDSEVRILWEQPYENGLGMFYTLVTYLLGFKSFGSEYKVMGLAPYGEPRFVDRLETLFETDENGGFRLHLPVRFTWSSLMAALPPMGEQLGLSPRTKEEELTQTHIDFAASLQFIFEREVQKMARYIRAATGEPNLLFCGGCAQNCVAAGKLRATGVFTELYNSPVGGDMGSGLGAALFHERQFHSGKNYRPDTRGFYLGSLPGPAPSAASTHKVAYKGKLHDYIAAKLAEEKIVAIVRGGMELGARALGARTILADPRAPGMQSRLNLAVKFRESFRPFAPAILAEHVGEWFDSTAESDYMNYTANLRPELRHKLPNSFDSLRERLDFPRCDLPSVIHVDYSARLQTIRPSVHADFHKFITAFQKITGVPILINTSFNVAGQPIVRTGTEAWDCFINTDIDLLVIGDEVFENPFERTREEKISWLNQFEKLA